MLLEFSYRGGGVDGKGRQAKLQAILRNLSTEVMLRSEILSAIDVKADLLDADKAPSDPATAAVKSIQEATGLDESAAKALLDQRSSSAEMTKGD